METKKNNFHSAQEVANMFSMSKKTLFSWEGRGLISKPSRDWRGWRLYSEKHIEEIRKIIERRKKSICKRP